MKKKLPYGIEIARLLAVIQSPYPECEPRNLDPVITAVLELLEQQRRDIGSENSENP